MFQIKFILIILGLTPHLKAQENVVLIQAGTANESDFNAYVKAHSNEGLESFSAWWLKNRIPLATEKELQVRFEKAQEEYLNGNLLKAKKLLLQLTEMELTEDWRREERKIFSYAYLRLAQLEYQPEAKRDLVQKARRGLHLKLDPSLFPPPLWKEFSASQFNAKSLENILLENIFPMVRYLLIDGNPYPSIKPLQIPRDNLKHRFTLVFDHAPPLSRIVTWEDFFNWNPNPISWVDGDCDHWSWAQNSTPNINYKIFFSDQCPQGKTLQVPKIISNANHSSLKELSLKTIPLSKLSTPSPTSPQSLWKNKWLWISIGVLGAGIYTLNQKETRSQNPSTQYGF
ncbi:MAG: hypothetical protein K1X29_07985 [Bdellovibrionales bacterium]|nr:hypothetical protein [Bdellovibrionales bacterium]